MSPVTLYDLPSKGRNACWSLNPWKTRLVLNYKDIDYKTDWLEYPDVAPTLKAAGFEPNEAGQPFPFTIPAVRFPDGAHAMESAKIVQELEKRYPEPSLHLDSKYFPLIRSLIPATSSALVPVILPPIPRLILSEQGAEYFNETRSKMFGMSLDQLGADRGGEQAWTSGLEILAKVAALLKEEEGPYFMGHTVSYADFIVVAFLQFAKRLEGGIFDRIVQFDSVFSVLYDACSKSPTLARDIDVSKLSITKTSTPKEPLPKDQLRFGRCFTDHMLAIEWTSQEGWGDPRIVPYQELRLDPAVCTLQYASSCFEGMKAYKDTGGELRLFRPEKNMARLNSSSARLALPMFDSNAVISLISELCKVESRCIPDERDYSLYLRPTIIGTESALGVGPPNSALLYVIASPSGPFWPTGFKAIQLEAIGAVRAWPGGVGDKKVGANYAPCVLPQREAALNGSQQNLWLFGEEEFVTEVGSMNLFVAMKDKASGRKQLITVPLDGTILEGVTRDSILTLARERMKDWNVIERKLTIGDLAEASDEGRLLEVFGSGTAVIISPVRGIFWKRTQRLIPCGLPENEESGPVAKAMFGWILSIQHGDEEHAWSLKI